MWKLLMHEPVRWTAKDASSLLEVFCADGELQLQLEEVNCNRNECKMPQHILYNFSAWFPKRTRHLSLS